MKHILKHIKLYIATFIGVAMFLFSSCAQEEKKDVITTKYDPEKIPMIDSDSVTMLVSDSGLIRYKLQTKTWLFFEQAKEPYWFFPNGFYVEQFDSLFHVEVSIKADTAWRYTKKGLWKLKGNVLVKNIQDETFASSELFWDEKLQKIYSHTYIEINRPNKLMLPGIGFEANQTMTEYRVFKPGGAKIQVDEIE